MEHVVSGRISTRNEGETPACVLLLASFDRLLQQLLLQMGDRAVSIDPADLSISFATRYLLLPGTPSISSATAAHASTRYPGGRLQRRGDAIEKKGFAKTSMHKRLGGLNTAGIVQLTASMQSTSATAAAILAVRQRQ